MPNKHLLILETLKDAEYYLKNATLMPIPMQQQDIISTQPDIQAYLLQNSGRNLPVLLSGGAG